MKTKEYINKNKWLVTLFWIVVTAIVTLSIEKMCDKIMPDKPMIIKEISDSVQIIHTYNFYENNDSSINTQLHLKLENIKLAQMYESEVKSRIKDKVKTRFNTAMLDAKFPKAKGYRIGSAMAYFTASIPSLQNQLLDFEISFFNENIIKDIYCLSLKIDSIHQNKRFVFFDENYYANNNTNIIRIANTLPNGVYEISVGVFFKKDQNLEYPCFYRISKIVNKQ